MNCCRMFNWNSFLQELEMTCRWFYVMKKIIV